MRFGGFRSSSRWSRNDDLRRSPTIPRPGARNGSDKEEGLRDFGIVDGGVCRRGCGARETVHGASGPMSFLCKACGRQRSGSPAVGEGVCNECRSTQMGRAVRLLDYFFEENVPSKEQIDALDAILDDASNVPPEGTSDGSISERRWTAMRGMIKVARTYRIMINAARAALEDAPQKPPR